MNFNMKKILIALTAVSSFGLTTCAAYDLGKDGTTYYKIDDPESATWNEVSFIVKDKCATCHTDEKPWYKPANTLEKPNTENPNFGLNKIGLEAFFDWRNNELANVKKCIVSQCGLENIPMPPKYATQLDDNEKTALLSFVQKLLDEKSKNDPSTLSSTFQDNCAGCHGSKGEGGSYPKLAGTQLEIEAFKQIIQNGKGGMKPMPNYDITKAESDLAELKKLP